MSDTLPNTASDYIARFEANLTLKAQAVRSIARVIIENLPSAMRSESLPTRLALFQHIIEREHTKPIARWSARVSANNDRAPAQAASAAIGGG